MNTALRALIGLIVVGGLVTAAGFVGGAFDTSAPAPKTQVQKPGAVVPITPIPKATTTRDEDDAIGSIKIQ